MDKDTSPLLNDEDTLFNVEIDDLFPEDESAQNVLQQENLYMQTFPLLNNDETDYLFSDRLVQDSFNNFIKESASTGNCDLAQEDNNTPFNNIPPRENYITPSQNTQQHTLHDHTQLLPPNLGSNTLPQEDDADHTRESAQRITDPIEEPVDQSMNITQEVESSHTMGHFSFTVTEFFNNLCKQGKEL
jgi:hypothetical protein